MASNVGIAFHTPEEFFLDDPPRAFARSFDPAAFLAKTSGESATAPAKFTKNNELDIVMYVGSPGAGKSTFYWTQLQPLGYERVNPDILKTVWDTPFPPRSYMLTTPVRQVPIGGGRASQSLKVRLRGQYQPRHRCACTLGALGAAVRHTNTMHILYCARGALRA